MAFSGDPNDVLNPLTAKAFLPPTIVKEVAIGTYFHILSIGSIGPLKFMTLIWDIVNNLCNDYRLLTKHRVALPVVAYFASRISLLVFAVGRACTLTVETDTCRKLVLIFWSVFAVCLWFTSLLFYLAMDGMTCFVPTMLDAVDIGPTKHYFELIVQDLPQVSSLIAYLINDTTSYRFLSAL